MILVLALNARMNAAEHNIRMRTIEMFRHTHNDCKVTFMWLPTEDRTHCSIAVTLTKLAKTSYPTKCNIRMLTKEIFRHTHLHTHTHTHNYRDVTLIWLSTQDRTHCSIDVTYITKLAHTSYNPAERNIRMRTKEILRHTRAMNTRLH